DGAGLRGPGPHEGCGHGRVPATVRPTRRVQERGDVLAGPQHRSCRIRPPGLIPAQIANLLGQMLPAPGGAIHVASTPQTTGTACGFPTPPPDPSTTSPRSPRAEATGAMLGSRDESADHTLNLNSTTSPSAMT